MTSTAWKPRPYQVTAAQHALHNPGAALFLEPGLGKTAISLAVVDILRTQKVVGGTLVIAPLRVCYSVWPREAAKWSDFSHLSVGILHGKAKDDVLGQKHALYVINPEGLQWLFSTLAGRKAWPFDNLIVDESTKFKNTQTLRFKSLKAVLPRFKRVLLLTGTPTANRLEDIFGQAYILDSGARLGKYITHFRREYFDEHRHHMGFSQWLPRVDSATRIKEKVQDVCLYMSEKDHLSLPPRIDNKIMVELPAAARVLYRKVEKDFFATVGDATVGAAHAAAAQMKLRQVVGGQVYADTGTMAVHTEKLDALSDLVEELAGQPLLVGVSFQHEAAAIQKMLKADHGIEAHYLGGGISPSATDRIVDEWNAGKLTVLLAHPQSVGHGLNLQAGGHAVCWYTLPWSLELYDQFNRRVYRQGQAQQVIIHHILATDTIDEDVLEALTNKARGQKSFLDQLKRHA